MTLQGKDLAKALGVDAAAVSRRKARGMPTDSVEAALAWSALHVRPRVGGTQPAPAPAQAVAERAAPRVPPAPPVAPSLQAPASTDYQTARARREQADAERAEIEVAKMAGRLVDKARVEAAVFDAFRALRDRVMNVPRRCASLVVGLTDAREIELAIADELRAALGGDSDQTGHDMAKKVTQ